MNEKTRALRAGGAFATTVAVAYAACAFLFWLIPDAAGTFMTALFHGLDFRRLQVGATAFSFAGFAYACSGWWSGHSSSARSSRGYGSGLLEARIVA